MDCMATTTTSAVPIPASQALHTGVRTRRRRIGASAGRALEILGHSIEYLIDESARDGSLAAHGGNTEAIQLLMRLNREIYFACPEIPSFGERLAKRLQSLLGW